MNQGNFEGTATELVQQLIGNAYFEESNDIAPANNFDILFHIFEDDMKNHTYEGKISYIEQIESALDQSLNTHKTDKKPVEVMKFELEFLRWSRFWQELIKSKLESRRPDFKMDLDSIWRYSIEYLTPDKAIIYLKGEYKNLLTGTMPGENQEKIKQRLKQMIEDLELIKIQKPRQEKKVAEADFEGLNEETEGNTASIDLNRYITREKAAHMLGVCYATLFNYKAKGILIPAKMGNRVYYDKEEIENYLKISKSR